MYSKTILVGRLGRDVEMRYTQDGTEVATFSLATDRGWGDKKKTVWYRVSCWRKLATSVAQYLHKGSLCLVEGELDEANAYMGKDGKPRASLELTANLVKFLDSKGNTQEVKTEEEIPF